MCRDARDEEVKGDQPRRPRYVHTRAQENQDVHYHYLQNRVSRVALGRPQRICNQFVSLFETQNFRRFLICIQNVVKAYTFLLSVVHER